MPFTHSYNGGATTEPDATPSSAPSSGFKRSWGSEPTPAPAAEAANTDWTLPALAAGAVGAGAYALTRNPKAAKYLGNAALDLRQVSMLSGLAPLKSLLGNIGAAAYGSIERGSTAPIRELLSGETLKDFGDAWKTGGQFLHNPGATGVEKINVFGRFMGAADDAAKKALGRAGYTPEEASIEMLQRPLPQSVAKAVQHPVGRYVLPFRQIPFNQPYEGIASWHPDNLVSTGQKVAQGVSVGQGVATGLSTDDPTLTGMSIATGGKRGLNVAAGTALGRLMKGNTARSAQEAVQGMSPLSEYGLGQAVTQPIVDPLRPLTQPAALTAYEKLMALFGQ